MLFRCSEIPVQEDQWSDVLGGISPLIFIDFRWLGWDREDRSPIPDSTFRIPDTVLYVRNALKALAGDDGFALYLDWLRSKTIFDPLGGEAGVRESWERSSGPRYTEAEAIEKLNSLAAATSDGLDLMINEDRQRQVEEERQEAIEWNKAHPVYPLDEDELDCDFDFPEPLDLFADEAAVKTPNLAREMLPDVIANYAFDEAERMGIDPAMIALPALTACAAAISDEIRIQPKKHDTTWTTSARMWVAIVADPGSIKSAAIASAVGPLEAVQARWVQEDQPKVALYKAQQKAWRKSKSMDAPPLRPNRRRTTVNDFTIEGLKLILRDNKRGVLVKCDELSGLIGSFDAYKAKGVNKDRPATLELWDGGPRTIDRANEDASVSVPNWGASVIGGIQPDKLRPLAASLSDDGLLQRFQLVYAREGRDGQDRTPDQKALTAYAGLIDRLVEFQCHARPITLSPAAQEWRKEVESRARDLKLLPTTPGPLKSHLAKWSGIFARLLLTLHIIECATPGEDLSMVVPGTTAKKARDLMLEFFLPNTLRLYRTFFKKTDTAGSHARWLAGHILAHGSKKLTVRDIQRAYRDLQDDAEGIVSAMRILESAYWLSPPDTSRRGSISWTVNPAVHRRFSERAASEAQRREEIRLEIGK